MIAGAFVALAAVAAVFLLGRLLSPPRLLQVERLTPSPKVSSSARFLPDGRSIVYTATPDGPLAAYLGELFRLSPGEHPVPLGVRNCRVLDVSASGELVLVWKREVTVDGRKKSTPVLARIQLSPSGAFQRVLQNLPTDVELWDVSSRGEMLMTTGGESGGGLGVPMAGVQEVRWLEPGAEQERLLDVGSGFGPALNAAGTQLSCTVKKGVSLESFSVSLLQAGQSIATIMGPGLVLDQSPDGKTLVTRVPGRQKPWLQSPD